MISTLRMDEEVLAARKKRGTRRELLSRTADITSFRASVSFYVMERRGEEPDLESPVA